MDAAAAAACALVPPPGVAQAVHFTTCPAPAPEDVLWASLWTLPHGRVGRVLILLLPLMAVMAFPIGAVTGALL